MDVAYIATVIGVILLSMTLHEAMHGFVAYWLGDETARLEGRLTLNPLRHIDPFLTIVLPVMLAIAGLPIFGGAKPVPFNPRNLRYGEWGVALVAAAGPLTNLLIAFVCYGLYVATGDTQDTAIGMILSVATLVNLGFFVFNILPIPPLDGSRVMYALAPEFIRRGMEFIERYGLIVVFLLVLLAGPVLGTLLQSAITGILRIFALLLGAPIS